MFTIEHDFDDIAITTLDANGEYPDVEVIMTDDVIYIRQVNDDTDDVQVVMMSYQQYKDIMAAWNLPSGAYYHK